jgi:DNA-binding MarR family transcriptional regulator
VDGSDATGLLVDALAPQATTIVEALRAFEDAEMRMRSRIRSQLGLGTTDLAALRYIRSREALGDHARGTDLRRRLGVSSAAATTITNRLTAAGFIEKPRDPTDGRARKLSLTAYAHQRIAEVLGDTESRLDDVLAAIPEDEATRIVELVTSATEIVADTAPD